MNVIVQRFLPGQDLQHELNLLVQKYNFAAGIILTCVGSLSIVVLRMAGAKKVKTLQGKFEIVSLVGTLSVNGNHIHLMVSDEEGLAFGGHLKAGCIINSTAEIAVGILPNYKFSRVPDEKTGYSELEVSSV